MPNDPASSSSGFSLVVKKTFIEIDDESPTSPLRRSKSDSDVTSSSSMSIATPADAQDSTTSDENNGQIITDSNCHVVFPSSESTSDITNSQESVSSREASSRNRLQPKDAICPEIAEEGQASTGRHADTCRCQHPRIKPCGYYFNHGCSMGENCKFCHHAKHSNKKRRKAFQEMRNKFVKFIGSMPEDLNVAAELYIQMSERFPDLAPWMESKMQTGARADVMLLVNGLKSVAAPNPKRKVKSHAGSSFEINEFGRIITPRMVDNNDSAGRAFDETQEVDEKQVRESGIKAKRKQRTVISL